MARICACILIATLVGCGDDPEPVESESAPAYDLSVVVPPVEVAKPVDVPTPAPSSPAHNYDERRDRTYFYVAAVSEEDRRHGRAVGGVSAFQYLGQNAEGEHILAGLNDNGTVNYRAKCAEPCKIIDTDYGRKIAYSAGSIIGSAFEDAFRGNLRVAEWAKAQSARAGTPESAPPIQPSALATLPPETVGPASQPVLATTTETSIAQPLANGAVEPSGAPGE